MRKLRYVRIGLAMGVGLLFTLVFFGITWGQAIVDWQLVPSLLRGLSPWALGVGAFVAWLLITLLIGRLYCSVFCPLGILQDVAARVFSLGKTRSTYRNLPRLRFLHFGVLALLCIPLLLGSAAGLALLEPYSLFGRFVNSLLVPAIGETNNLVAGLLLGFGSYAVAPVKVYWPPLWSLLLTSGLLLLLLGAVHWNGRVFCNTLCPAGAMLRLVAGVSVFRLKIKESLCNRCGSCQRACKAGCINRKTKEIDCSRCVLCFNCVDSCDKQGVVFEINPLWKRLLGRRQPEVEKPVALPIEGPTRPDTLNFSRRRFVFAGVGAAASLVPGSALIAAQGQGADNGGTGRGMGRKAKGRNRVFDYLDPLPASLPPGARDVQHFQANCTACQLCVSQCPSHGLAPGFLELGWKGMQQPVFDFNQGYCFYECNVCSQICPTGALTPLDLELKKRTRIGVARFFKRFCVVHSEGNECGACIEHCPVIAVTGKPYRADHPNLLLPEVDESLCIGCGICEWVCPVKPAAIRVEGLPVHELADVKVSKPLERVPDLSEDFPF